MYIKSAYPPEDRQKIIDNAGIAQKPSAPQWPHTCLCVAMWAVQHRVRCPHSYAVESQPCRVVLCNITAVVFPVQLVIMDWCHNALLHCRSQLERQQIVCDLSAAGETDARCLVTAVSLIDSVCSVPSLTTQLVDSGQFASTETSQSDRPYSLYRTLNDYHRCKSVNQRVQLFYASFFCIPLLHANDRLLSRSVCLSVAGVCMGCQTLRFI